MKHHFIRLYLGTPLFSRLRSGNRIHQRPSLQKQFPSKKISLLLASVLFSCSVDVNGATISMPRFYIGNADAPSAWGTILAQDYSPLYTFNTGGYFGLSGGEMLISLNEGESVVSATIQAASAASLEELDVVTYSKIWTLSLTSAFPSVGAQTGDQMWQQIGWLGHGPIWWRPENTSLKYVKAKFEVVTSQGTFVDDNSGSGYQMMFVPEPCAPLLFAVSLCCFLAKRRS